MTKKLLVLPIALAFVLGVSILATIGDATETERGRDPAVVNADAPKYESLRPIEGEPLPPSGEHRLMPEACQWLSYWCNAYYFWSIPDQYGDDFFNQRFTPPGPLPCTLKTVCLAFYEPGSANTTGQGIDVYIWDTDASGKYPGTVRHVVNVPGASLQWFPSFTCVDVSAANIVVNGDFHVGYTVVDTTLQDTISITSDEGTCGLQRSSENWAGAWGLMIDDWGLDVNFLIEVEICCADSGWNNHKMHFPQLPDEYGWDVNATQPLVLADDWMCSDSGWVKDIHFWGSWMHGEVGEIDRFVLSIHSDQPDTAFSHGTCSADGDCDGDGVPLAVADLVYLINCIQGTAGPCCPGGAYHCDMNGDCKIDSLDAIIFSDYFSIGLPAFDTVGGYPVPTCCDSIPYSRPDSTLWERSIYEFDVTAFDPPALEGWYDPEWDEAIPDDHNAYFRYDVYLDSLDWFWQDSGVIYWLNISAILVDSGQWGWKSSYHHWNDDAVWAHWGELDWVDMWEPSDPISSWFAAWVDPSGWVEGYGIEAWGDGWYLYPSGWWNIWFWDHPFDTTRAKKIHISLDVRKWMPNDTSFIEFAVNWSTDWWSLVGNPPGEPRVPPVPETMVGAAPESPGPPGMSCTLSGPGAGPGGLIYAGLPVTFDINMNNATGGFIAGMANGFRVYSPDAAIWNPITYDSAGGLDTCFTSVYTGGLSITGSGADTCYVGGTFSGVDPGVPNGYDDVVLKISTQVPVSEVGKTLCIDSSYWPPAGTWLWADSVGNAIYPAWTGPHCFEIDLSPIPEDSAIGRYTLLYGTNIEGHFEYDFYIPWYNPEWVSIDIMGYNFVIDSTSYILHDCVQSLDLSFVITGDTAEEPPPTGACCYPPAGGADDNLCTVTTQDDCERNLGGVYQGDGTNCGGMQACCLPNNDCIMADALCCVNELGGVPQGAGTNCGGTQACCLPNDDCVDADSICCVNELGGVPQGTGTSCTAKQACCMLDGTCRMLDPLCCIDINGAPQGANSQCTGTKACCMPNGTCKDLDPLCCDDQGGTLSPIGAQACLGDHDGDLVDDACEDPLEEAKMHYPQLPDENGWDVNATWPLVLADDWECSETGWVKDVHFWGSWRHGLEGVIDHFIVSIHGDIPASQSPTGYSMPDTALWDTAISDFGVVPIHPYTWEGWYDPSLNDVLPNDHNSYFAYHIDLDTSMWFWQDSGTIYWLNISAVVEDTIYQWGWKNSEDHFNDDAVWADIFHQDWRELYEPNAAGGLQPIKNTFEAYVYGESEVEGWGQDAYGSGWYRYEDPNWWNIWFFDHPYDTTRYKVIKLGGLVSIIEPAYPCSVVVAINWSTDAWDDPEAPPLPSTSNPSDIGRATIVDMLGFEGSFMDSIVIPDYNPVWVSVDVWGYNFHIMGEIEHECIPKDTTEPQSLDLSFVITGEPPCDPPYWKFHYRGINSTYFDTCLSGLLTVWGTIDCDTTGYPPLFHDTAFRCNTYSGKIDSQFNDILMNFKWHCWCNNDDWMKLAAPYYDYDAGYWRLQVLGDWHCAHPELPTLSVANVAQLSGIPIFTAVNLNTLIAAAPARTSLQEADSFLVVDGTCAELPGYLIGTTPIEFDPFAPPPALGRGSSPDNGDPFSTTPYNGWVHPHGEVEMGEEGGCCVGITGNVDGDPGEIIDIGDVTALLDYLYIRPGVEPPDCMPEANVDGDLGGVVDIGDVTALLDYLYIRPGVEPPAPCP